MDKQTLRERVWDDLEECGVARFPFPPHGRIPNFEGADRAAERLAETTAWSDAAAIKANPDAPQRPARRLALGAGQVVYVAVPRLADEECFVRLAPDELDDFDRATTITGSAELGEHVRPEGVEPIDCILCGSVAVTEQGNRIGKGEGYSDLEYAMLRAFGLVTASVPVVTTVHERQVIDEDVETASHDVPLDLVVTPERVIEVEPTEPKPSGIDWESLSEDRLAQIPALERMWDRTSEES